MFTSKLNLFLAALLLAGAVRSFAQTADEAKLIADLQSGDQKAKADACRVLAHVGTKAAVPALAALLTDEKNSHMARYALETIPDPSVDEALRAALSQTKGRLLAGVIGSLGVRKDAKAIEPIAKFLSDPDKDVAQAAARALGKIGTVAAGKAIDNALGSVSAANQLAFCEGLFRCAEALATAGQKDDAITIYDRLSAIQGPHQVRAGALRGSVLTRGESQGLPILMKAYDGADFILVDAAARTGMEMPGAAVTKAFAEELSKGSADKQVLATKVLGKRADAAALPALYAAAKTGDKTVRVAAIRAIPEIGSASSASTLIAVMSDSEREIAQAAQEALAGLQGPEVDQAILAMLNGTDANQRVQGADLVARRRMKSALPDLLKAASAPETKVREVALKRVGELGGPEQVPTLLAMLTQAKGGQEIDAAEQALSAICTRANDPDGCSDRINANLSSASPAQKSALLRVLSAIGGSKALTAVRAAVSDSNAEVHSAAIRALGSWESADAAPHLLDLAKSSSNSAEKQLCLRSYFNLASSHTELPAENRLTMCKDASALAQKPEEKKILLSALGSISSQGALDAIAPYLQDVATKEEASAGCLGIAEKILKPRNVNAQTAAKLVPVLEKVVNATANAGQQERAKALLKQASTKAGIKAL
jgi:HEAT repeat protein